MRSETMIFSVGVGNFGSIYKCLGGMIGGEMINE
jgi:hypothetical protein